MSLAQLAPPPAIPVAVGGAIACDVVVRRTAVTTADLYVMLEREFRRRKSPCRLCFVQLPYRVDAHGGECNWEMQVPADCGCGCAAALARMVGDFQDLYILSSD
jgi:hypothetical protein